MIDSMIRTLDGVCLDELAALLQHILWDGIPCHALGKAEVDVRRAELVDVKPEQSTERTIRNNAAPRCDDSVRRE